MTRHTHPLVVITGASAGVGRATARRFAAGGADVGLLARGRDGLDAAVKEVEAAGGRAMALAVDVADADSVDVAAEQIEEALGPIRVWVNNAMVTVLSPAEELTAAEVRRVTDVTYLGTVHGTLAALRRMRERGEGVIVQVGSALAYRAIPLQAAYCAAKHAIKGFTDSLRVELRHERSRIQVTTVHLPALNTPQFEWCRTRLPRQPRPVPPIYQPEVAAEAIWFAAHHRRREVWVGAPTALTIVGNHLAPRLLDRYLARTGYESQQADALIDAARPDNLDEPVAGDHGARGVFDPASTDRVPPLWAPSGPLALLGAAAEGLTNAVGRAAARRDRG